MKQVQSLSPLNPDAIQRVASDPALSVWVAASAGSGKTKILSDRVLRLLLTGVPPQKLLCLTFTRAAAAEMSLRISSRLSKWATCDDASLEAEIAALQGSPPKKGQKDKARRLFSEVLNCPGGLRLRTIHSFCQEILNRFPIEAGLSPSFAVLDEGEAQDLKTQSLDDLLRQATSSPQSDIGRAMSLLARLMGDAALFDLLGEVSSKPDRLELALQKAKDIESLSRLQHYAAGFDETDSPDRARRRACDAVDADILRDIAKLIAGGAKTYAARAQAILDFLALDEATRPLAFENYTRAFLKTDGEPYAKWASPKEVAACPDLVEILSAEAARLQKALAEIEALDLLDQTRALVLLALAARKLYVARKKSRSALDYDDLILKTNALLHREGIAPWVLFKLDGGLDHILVDEAQDTSMAQWQIVDILAQEFFSGETARTSGRTLFVVGDEKQSIYSFQGADPDIFAAMHAHFRDKIQSLDVKSFADVPLDISFRSAPAVLQAVDAVFAKDETRRGVASSSIHHFPFRKNASGRVEVWKSLDPPPASENKDEAEGEVWKPPVAYEKAENPPVELAEVIADRIRAWLDKPAFIRGRPVTAGDIMILVQRRNDFVDHLIRSLKSRNIPVAGIDRMNLTLQLPVMDLMALLQFVLLPEDDLNLATVLRGPLLGLSEEGLMNLALGREGSLWQALRQNPETAVYRDYLASWLSRADQVSPFALLAEILHSPCPADRVSGKKALWKRLGPQAIDPIDELLNKAQEFADRYAPSLQAFLHWLVSTETEIKRELEQSGGQVRLTTVHAAKGLEAPIVILPDTTRLPNQQKLDKILWNDGLPFYVPREVAHPYLKGLRDLARDKQMQEYRRLLYVALTRAADWLCVTGYRHQRSDRTGQNWYELVAEALLPLDEPSAHAGEELIALADPSARDEKAPLHTETANDEIALPAWALSPAPKDLVPPRPFIPSRPDGAEPAIRTPSDARFQRGRLIHRLLQSLPDLAPDLRLSSARRFLANPQNGLTLAQQAEIENEVIRLLDDPSFASLFGPESRAEVPLTGRVGDLLIAGQVDRLCVMENEVWVVDYKTNRPPPPMGSPVPEVYRRQMAAYHTLLCQLYPSKRVRCFLLWTYAPLLMPLDEEVLSLS
jgi:ATP-dependent helicase/nuclease subunit A